MSPHFGNFDNIFTSVLLLFETATLERWPDIMLYMADGAWDQNRALYTAPVMAPHGDIYGFVILFWIGWIFLSAFVIMNLFVGVVVENFQRNKERLRRDGLPNRAAAEVGLCDVGHLGKTLRARAGASRRRASQEGMDARDVYRL